MIWRRSSTRNRCKKTASEMNHFQKSSVQLFWKFERKFPVSNLARRSHHERIFLKRVLLNYFDDLEKIFGYRTPVEIHIRSEPFELEFCWSILMIWRKPFTSEPLQKITSEMNYFEQNSVKSLWWFRQILRRSTIYVKLHEKWIIWIRVLCYYFDGLNEAFHHQISLKNHTRNGLFWAESCCTILLI